MDGAFGVTSHKRLRDLVLGDTQDRSVQVVTVCGSQLLICEIKCDLAEKRANRRSIAPGSPRLVARTRAHASRLAEPKS